MNISFENKIIWLVPEETESKIICSILKNHSFSSCEEKNEWKPQKIENSCSNNDIIPNEYENYQIISLTRNPYDRVWLCYLNYYKKVFFIDKINETKESFNRFIHNSFINTSFGVKIDSFHSEKSFLGKWRFNNYIPNDIIKVESFFDDLKKIDLVKNLDFLRENFKIDENSKILKYSKEMYIKESAKKVYNYYKNHFLFFGYCPFSFTNEELSINDKINFIHYI